MRKTLNFVMVLSAILVLFVAPLVSAERARSGYEGLMRYLGLSADQIAQINQEVGNFEKSQQPAFAKLSQCEAQLETAMQSGDAATIGRVSLDRVALNRQITEERKALQNRVRSILDPQQTEKLDRALEVLSYVGVEPAVLGPFGLGAAQERMGVPGGGGRRSISRPQRLAPVPEGKVREPAKPDIR